MTLFFVTAAIGRLYEGENRLVTATDSAIAKNSGNSAWNIGPKFAVVNVEEFGVVDRPCSVTSYGWMESPRSQVREPSLAKGFQCALVPTQWRIAIVYTPSTLGARLFTYSSC
jgi:hypothetical protein